MSGSIVILTGAGISKASGLETFSGDGGIWNTHDVDKIAGTEALAKNPTQVLSFYDDMRRKLLSDEVSPNAAHYALARLEGEWAGQVIIITQNIDDLHERAGNTQVIHSHGELKKHDAPHVVMFSHGGVTSIPMIFVEFAAKMRRLDHT